MHESTPLPIHQPDRSLQVKRTSRSPDTFRTSVTSCVRPLRTSVYTGSHCPGPARSTWKGVSAQGSEARASAGGGGDQPLGKNCGGVYVGAYLSGAGSACACATAAGLIVSSYRRLLPKMRFLAEVVECDGGVWWVRWCRSPSVEQHQSGSGFEELGSPPTNQARPDTAARTCCKRVQSMGPRSVEPARPGSASSIPYNGHQSPYRHAPVLLCFRMWPANRASMGETRSILLRLSL